MAHAFPIQLAALLVLSSAAAAQQAHLGAAGANLLSYRGQSGKRLALVCPPGGAPGTVYGTDVYTDDSSVCSAAVHAGVVSLERGGPVTVLLGGAQQSYRGSTRNGVTSQDFAAWPGSYSFDRSAEPATVDWATTAGGVEGYIGSVAVNCPAGGQVQRVWGTDLYTSDSSLCSAAAHAGVISPASGGPVTVRISGGQDAYTGSRRNGVESAAYGRWKSSFQVAAARTALTSPLRAGRGERVPVVSAPAPQPAAPAPQPTAVAAGATRAGAGPVVSRDPCAGTRAVVVDQPCITGVFPDSAAHGMQLFIRGSGLAGTKTKVGGADMTPFVVGDTLIKAYVMPGSTDGSIVVTNPSSGKSHTASIKLLAPVVSRFTPGSGRAGDKIVITGYGFADQGNSAAQVAFGNNTSPSAVVDGSGTLANAIVPPGNSTGIITVAGSTDIARSQEEFIELPEINSTGSYANATVEQGGNVSISGKALQNITAVSLGQPATIISKSYSYLSFRLPAFTDNYESTATLGKASFTHRDANNSTGTMTGGPSITVRVQPRITALVPDSGFACGSASVKGVGLATPPGSNFTPVVDLGPVRSPNAYQQTIREIGFSIPKGATTGPVKLKVYGGDLTSPMPFRIVAPMPSAYIEAFPPTVRPGSVLKFKGRLQEVTKVSFTGAAELTQGWTVTPIPNESMCMDLMEITVPPGATSGPVTFTNAAGTATHNLQMTP